MDCQCHELFGDDCWEHDADHVEVRCRRHLKRGNQNFQVAVKFTTKPSQTKLDPTQHYKSPGC